MRCKNFVCANTIIVDRLSKRISAINVLEEVQFPSFPAAIQAMIFSSFEKESGEPDRPEIQLEVLMNGTQIRSPLQLNIAFRDGKLIARNLVSLGIIPVSEGLLTFRLFGAITYSYDVIARTLVTEELVSATTPNPAAPNSTV